MLTTIVVLAILGSLALVLEVFLPGGVLGTAGGLAVLAAATMAVASDALEPLPLGGRLVVATGIVAASAAIFGFSMKFFPRTPFGRKLTLETEVTGAGTPDAAASLAGLDGTAETPLRPSGRATIAGHSYDVQAEEEFINSGDPVTVTRTDGPLVYVRGRKPTT